MFEALFILTTIDAGTRIARYLFQETLGKVYAPFARSDWLPGALIATALVTLGWAALVWEGGIRTIWPMFGIANQLLAVLALAIVTTWLVNSGRGRYAFVTIPPMLFVTATTLSAGTIMGMDPAFKGLKHWLMLFVISSVCAVVLMAVVTWVQRWALGLTPEGRPAR
jgi:carbon starvation protein